MARGNRGRGSKPSRGARGSPHQGGGRGRGGSSSGTPGSKNARDAELNREAQAIAARLGFLHMNTTHPRGGRGRGGFRRGAGTPKFNEFEYTYRGAKHRRGQGLGFLSPYDDRHSNALAPRQPRLQTFDLVNRPLLKPVVFVRAGTLFQDHDEIFKSTTADNENDDVPTANQIDDVFAHGFDSSQAPTISNTPTNLSHVNLNRFTDPPLNVLSGGSVDSEEIPVLSWPFTAAQLEASAVQVTPPASLQPTNKMNEESSSLTRDDVVAVPVTTTLNEATTTSAELTEQPTTGVQIDIDKLFQMAAMESALPQATTTSSQVLSAPSIARETREHAHATAVSIAHPHDELFFLDTDSRAGATWETALHGAPSEAHSSATSAPTARPAATPLRETSSVFIIDTEGDTGIAAAQKIRYRVHRLDAASRPLGEHEDSSSSPSEDAEDDDGDDIVVFVPTSRSQSHPVSRRPSVPDISLADVKLPNSNAGRKGGQHALSRQSHDVWKKKSKKQDKRKRRRARRHAERQAELAGLREPEEGAGHPDGEPRVGDSDIEWGSDGPPAGPSFSSETRLTHGQGRNAPAHHVSDDHGMDVDSDLELEDTQYERMLAGLLGHRDHTTIDDVNDQAKLLTEDNDVSSGEESDANAIEAGSFDFAIETQLEAEDDEESSDSSEEDENLSLSDEDEDVSFRTQLARIRVRAKNPTDDKSESASEAELDSQDDDDYDALFGGDYSWQDQGGVALDIQDFLDQGLRGMDRKERKDIFRAIANGEFNNEIVTRNMDMGSGSGMKKKKEGAYVPSELQGAWKRDRAKKAEYKKARAEKRRLAALDPFSVSNSRAKGKGKAIVWTEGEQDSVHSEDSDGEPGVTNISPIVDLVSLTAQIRMFVKDIGRETMVLPPMTRESRKRVHEIAAAFHLKSKSTGKGDNRRTTLIRTSRTGIGIRQGKITAILRRGGADIPSGRPHGPARHREGDIVGQKAAKIDEHNVGFKLLQRMGWKEGERIGVTGGLAAPLPAVIKNSKLGLGAGTVRWST